MASPHIVVVGGGLAGLAAAAGALARGARVTLLDKEKGLGGNSIKATSGMNAAVTEHQKRAGIEDCLRVFAEDIIKSGQGSTRAELAQSLAARSAGAIKFLDSVLPQPLSSVALLGGHSIPRTHRFDVPDDARPVPVGFTVIKSVKDYLLKNPNLTVKQNVRVTDLEFDKKEFNDFATPNLHRVTGVLYEEKEGPESAATTQRIAADSVVIAAGGFAASVGSEDSLVKEYSPLAAKCRYTTNGAFSTGDLLRVAQKHGIQTEGLDKVQMHPTGFVDPKRPLDRTKFLCPEVVRGVGAVLVNRNGDRFVNELLRRDQVSSAIFEHGARLSSWGMEDNAAEDTGKVALLVMNDQVRRGVGVPNFDFYCSRGLIQKFDNLKALADHFDLPNLVESVASEYGTPSDKTGKTHFPTKFSPEETVFASFVTPSVHYCMGGMSVNDEMQLRNADGETIVNLFAAGEAAGGLHGCNRLGGNGLLESGTFGHLAGSNAAEASMSEPQDALAGETAIELIVSSVISAAGGLPNLGEHTVLRLRFGKSLLHSLKKDVITQGFRLTTSKGEVADAILVPAGIGRADFVFKADDLPKFIDLVPGETVTAVPIPTKAERLGDSVQHNNCSGNNSCELVVDCNDHRAISTGLRVVRGLKDVKVTLTGDVSESLKTFFENEGAKSVVIAGKPTGNFIKGVPEL